MKRLRVRLTVALAAGMLATAGPPARALDLVEAWQAAERNGLELLSARQAKQAGDARRQQATALWNTTVHVTGTAGIANSSTATRGAQFSGPGLGSSNDIAFNTSVDAGTTDRWLLQARKPLASGELDARQRSLELASQIADAEWTDARQGAMLRVAERYFDVLQAAETLHVLRRQQTAVDRAHVEVRDRFVIGDIPVTDTHEAAARSEAIRAQVVAAETQLALARSALADATGLEPGRLQALAPGRAIAPAGDESLEAWIAAAVTGNPRVRAQATGAAVAREQAARHTLKAAAAVDLVAQWGRERVSGHGDFGSANTTSSGALVGMQVSVPLYTGGLRSARREEALSLAAKALTDTDHLRQQVTQQTRAAWLGLTAGQQRLVALERNLAASRARLDATRLAQQVGDRTTLDRLNAENDAAATELAVLQARVTLLLDRMRLAALAGKLDEAVLSAVNTTLNPQGDPR